VPLARKPFAEFLGDLAAHLAAGGSEDDPIAETAQLKIVEVAPGDWSLRMVLDHAVEVISDESFPTKEEAIEVTIDRMEECMDLDQICADRIQ
jgi:hypothetical protein